MDTETILLVAILVMGFSVFMYFTNKKNQIITKNKPIKTTKDELENLVKEQVRVIQDNYIAQIEMLKKDKSSIQNKLNRIEGLYYKLKSEVNEYDESEESDSIESLMSQYDIDPQKAIEYTKKLGLNPQALANPALQNVVWEKIKEHQDIALMLGIIRPKGMVQQITPNTSTSDTQNLYAELQKNGNFA